MGILVTDDLKPSVQYSVRKGGSEGNASSGCHQENFFLNNEEDYQLLFNGFVQSCLEYYVCPVSLFGEVQCRAIKLVHGLKQYDERLKLLCITSLQKRRIRDLIQVFRTVKGFDS